MVEVLAVIPARGGSKSIPRKNIKLLGVYPLIAYSIAAALQAQKVTRVIVSTDDEEIAVVARAYGAEVPFLRPAEHARDDTLDLPVFQHALAWLQEQENYAPALVVQLRPTTPYRPEGMVDAAIQIMLDNHDATSVRGVVPSGQNPYKMWRVPDTGPMIPLLESEFQEPYNMPRQQLPPTFWQTGHIDVIRSEVIQAGSMSGQHVYPLQINPRYTVDLDTPLDWERASWQLKDPALVIVKPQTPQQNPLPAKVDLVVFDFDGVMTDNKVYVDQHGVESVLANRGDGMGIEMLRKAGFEMMVLSTEPNPVVATRCKKLQLPYLHGIGKKGEALTKIINDRSLDPANIVYIGNDVNDLPCFSIAGCAIAVADAHPAALAAADFILTKNGGDGAVREFCDMLLAQMEASNK